MLFDLSNVESILGSSVGVNGDGGGLIEQFIVTTDGIPANQARFVTISTTGFADLTLLQQNDGTTQNLSFTFDTETNWDHENLANEAYFTGGTGDSIPTKWVLDSGVDGHFTNEADETLTPDGTNVVNGLSVSINSTVEAVVGISGSTFSLSNAIASSVVVDYIRGTEFFDAAGDIGCKITTGGFPASTLAYIRSDTVDLNTDFDDLSQTMRIVTPNGDVEHSTDFVDAGFGSTMIKFDGTGDFLTMPDSPAWNILGVNWTIEFRHHKVAATNSGFLSYFGHGDDSGSKNINEGDMTASTRAVRWLIRNATVDVLDINTSGGVIDDDAKNHIAFVKEGTTYSIYVNGIREATGTELATPIDLGTAFNIGRRSAAGGQFFKDYLSEIRVSNFAVYSGATYTVPTAPFPAATPLDRTYVIIPNNSASMASTANLTAVNDFSTKKPDGSTESVTVNGENIYIAIPDTLRENFRIKESTGSRIIAKLDAGVWKYASTADAAPGQTFTPSDANNANAALSQAMDNGAHNQMTYIEFSALTNNDLIGVGSQGGDGQLMGFGTAGDLTGAALGFNSSAGGLPQALNIYFAFDGSQSEINLPGEEVRRYTGTTEVKIEPTTQLNGTIILQTVS